MHHTVQLQQIYMFDQWKKDVVWMIAHNHEFAYKFKTYGTGCLCMSTF